MALETGVYYEDGCIIAKSEYVKVYRDNYDTYLEIGPGHNMWALESEIEDYKEQINDKPKGDCLEIGLGLGVASSYILSCSNVKSLTTIEKNKDVINVHHQIKQDIGERLGFPAAEKNHTIINNNGLSYVKKCDVKYDYIFMDFYSLIDDETLPKIEEMVLECKKIKRYGGKIDGWFDKYTPDIFVKKFNKLFS